MNIEYLTATTAFQILLQSTADVVDCRSDGEKVGIIKQWMSHDEAIAIVLAWRVTGEYEQHVSPKLMMSLLMNYCRDDITNAYAVFVCQLLQKDGVEISPDQLKNKQYGVIYDVIIDVEEFLISGRARTLGFKSSWDPFREPLSTQWQRGLA